MGAICDAGTRCGDGISTHGDGDVGETDDRFELTGVCYWIE